MPQPRITVTALQVLVYEGRSYRIGESFQAKPIDAATLNYQRKISLTRPSRSLNTRALEPEPEPVKRKRGRPRKTETADSPRVYQRRDLVPEP